jgi:AcrR family transcriptional regulator
MGSFRPSITMKSRQAAKKDKYHHGDLRKALIEVSVDVIDKQGVDALNLRGLALLAGVSSGAPYHHFTDRSELLAAIAQEGFELLEAAMVSEGTTAVGDTSERLAALGRAYVRFATTHRGHFRVMFRGDTSGGTATALAVSSDRAYQLLFQAIEACQRAGTAPPGDPKPLVLHAWSTVHGLATLCVDAGLSRMGIAPDHLAPMITGLTGQMFSALAKTPASKLGGLNKQVSARRSAARKGPG